MPETLDEINELEILVKYSRGAWIRVRTDTPPPIATGLKKYLEGKGFTVDLRPLQPEVFDVDPLKDVTLFVEQEEQLGDDALRLLGGYLDAAREYLSETHRSQVFVLKPETDNLLLKFAPNTLGSRSHHFSLKFSPASS